MNNTQTAQESTVELLLRNGYENPTTALDAVVVFGYGVLPATERAFNVHGRDLIKTAAVYPDGSAMFVIHRTKAHPERTFIQTADFLSKVMV